MRIKIQTTPKNTATRVESRIGPPFPGPNAGSVSVEDRPRGKARPLTRDKV